MYQIDAPKRDVIDMTSSLVFSLILNSEEGSQKFKSKYLSVFLKFEFKVDLIQMMDAV